MTLNLERLIWKCLWDFLIKMSSKELKEFHCGCGQWTVPWWAQELLELGRDMTWPDGLEPDMLDGTLMRGYKQSWTKWNTMSIQPYESVSLRMHMRHTHLGFFLTISSTISIITSVDLFHVTFLNFLTSKVNVWSTTDIWILPVSPQPTHFLSNKQIFMGFATT